jgi:hypothetical protein
MDLTEPQERLGQFEYEDEDDDDEDSRQRHLGGLGSLLRSPTSGRRGSR